jgi:hypothetical protein
MTVLLVDTESLRRCDESCYDAKHTHCDCICGGENHRLGLEKAVQHSRSLTDEDGFADEFQLAFQRIWLIKYGQDHTYGTCQSQEEFAKAERELLSWGAKNIRRVEL